MNDDDLELLRFEKKRWNYPAAKATAIRERWSISETVYYQRLNALLDQPEALAAEPQVVLRLRRLRESRQRRRRVP